MSSNSLTSSFPCPWLLISLSATSSFPLPNCKVNHTYYRLLFAVPEKPRVTLVNLWQFLGSQCDWSQRNLCNLSGMLSHRTKCALWLQYSSYEIPINLWNNIMEIDLHDISYSRHRENCFTSLEWIGNVEWQWNSL